MWGISSLTGLPSMIMFLVVDDIAFLFLVIFDLLLAMLSLLVLLKMMSIWVCHSLVFFMRLLLVFGYHGLGQFSVGYGFSLFSDVVRLFVSPVCLCHYLLLVFIAVADCESQSVFIGVLVLGTCCCFYYWHMLLFLAVVVVLLLGGWLFAS